ncbi:DUF7344 domain-containing protein [Salinirubrum litoreum]|uniref:ArsR family transcriptional regulator n=1 Tax=Salinirubrum litoreum TaxID=1126234 RepID=A0ABD5R8T0_9EURY|nr:hypothetical protein [Salinirubrum litoreum]
MVSVPSSERGRDTEPATDSSRQTPEESASTLTPAVRHEVLVNDRRRAIVELLDDETTLRTLADEVARVEAGGGDPDRKTRQSVYITLHQCHLPKLDEFGVVTYDADRKQVRPAAGLWAIRAYRDRIAEYTTRRQEAVSPLPYAGLGLLGIGGLLAGAAGVAPTASWVVAAGAFLGVAGLAGRAVWSERRG